VKYRNAANILFSMRVGISRDSAKGCDMKIRLRIGFVLVASLFIICGPMFAHHGGSDYDIQHPVTLKGTVTEFYWSNPHCQVFLDVKDGSGKVVNWTIETLAPAVLKRAGWSRETLHTGNQISITFVPSKKGTPVGMLRRVVLPDGSELTGGSLGEQPSQ
jgi:Family of unknown function (DUF6152)